MKNQRRIWTLLAATVLAVAGNAAGQPPPGNWEAIHAAHVEVDGRIDPTGALYLGPRGEMTLVVSDRIGDMLLLETKTRALHRVVGGEVRLREGAATVGEGVRTEAIGSYSVADSVASFAVEGRSVRMIPIPPLTGEVTADSLLRHVPEYGIEMRFYEPYAPAIQALRAQDSPAEVIALFSIHSGRCRVQVPRWMRVAAEAGNPNLKARYLAVPSLVDSTRAAYRARYLPTFVVLRGGKEIGRIVGRPRESVEEDLLAILRGMY